MDFTSVQATIRKRTVYDCMGQLTYYICIQYVEDTNAQYESASCSTLVRSPHVGTIDISCSKRYIEI